MLFTTPLSSSITEGRTNLGLIMIIIQIQNLKIQKKIILIIVKTMINKIHSIQTTIVIHYFKLTRFS